MLLFYFFLTIIGLVVGSFLGMLTYRLPRGLPITGRSFCDSCKKMISWNENIPVVSFFYLSGKCKNCGKKISWRYPIIELTTTAGFLTTGFLWMRQNSDFLYLLLLLCLLLIFLALAIIDIEHTILPDFLLLLLLLLTLLMLLSFPSPTLFTNLSVGTIAYSFFLLLFLVTRGRGMGFGDVKLSFIIPLFLGFPGSIVWFMLSFLTGAVIGVVLLVLGKARLGHPIPFGPFLLFSAWITLFFGDFLWRWYGRLS